MAASAAVLRSLNDEQGQAVQYLINQNNAEQQEIVRTTIREVMQKAETERNATQAEISQKHDEVTRGIEEVRAALKQLDQAQRIQEATTKGQTEFINAEFLKAQKLAGELSDMDFRMSELNTEIVDKTASTQAELNNLLGRSCTDLEKARGLCQR